MDAGKIWWVGHWGFGHMPQSARTSGSAPDCESGWAARRPMGAVPAGGGGVIGSGFFLRGLYNGGRGGGGEGFFFVEGGTGRGATTCVGGSHRMRTTSPAASLSSSIGLPHISHPPPPKRWAVMSGQLRAVNVMLFVPPLGKKNRPPPPSGKKNPGPGQGHRGRGVPFGGAGHTHGG